jgi:UDP-N-acetylmuramate dehydrogenase
MSHPNARGPSNPAPAEIARHLAELASLHPGRVSLDVPLRGLTTFRIGGPARGVCRLSNVDEARRFQELAALRGLPTFLLGGGSNVLADDRGFAGLILKMEIAHLSVRGERVTAGAGLGFDQTIRQCLEAGLVGLEFASGIPGTVGGAVVGNAGCYGHEIGEHVTAVTLLRPDGRLERVGREDLAFAYRRSALKGGRDLVLEVEFRLRRGDVAAAGEMRAGWLADRRRKHPVRLPCAGSYFQNLPPAEPGGRRQAAGALLDRAGVKRLRVGGAGIYHKHANIIVNRGGATSLDVLELAARMKAAVRARFGVDLEEEVRHLSFEPRADAT